MKTIYYNGKVYTGDLPLCEAFSIEKGRFVSVGTNEDVASTATVGDEMINLKGCFVCPGFNDSHMHLLNFGQSLLSAPLGEHTESLSAVLGCLKAHLAKFPLNEGGWLTGRGWNQDYFTDVSRMPNRFDLDSVSTSVPIIITRACGHCCSVNSKALELAGINANTISPEGGSIGFQNCEPDGRLFDNAMDLVLNVMPLPGEAELKSMIICACRELNRYGITSSQTDDYCVFREIAPHRINAAFRELADEGKLTVRVNEQCNFTELEELKRFIAAGNITGEGDTFFRIGPLKLLGDGALGSRTAHLSLPYLNDPNNKGLSLFSPEHLSKMIAYAHSKGMQIAVHAIGDACLDEVLDAYQASLKTNPRSDHRHGIVHCQITRCDQLKRMIELGLHIYAQSVFLDYDNHIIEKLVPESLAKSSYNWKTLLRGGATVSNGSDCPVELPDVMKGIECAVTRRSLDGTGPFLPDEAFTVKEALDSFTSAGAYASFEEDIKGRIAAGYLADFVVLGSDPFETEVNKLHSIEVLQTYLGGKIVYCKN